MYDFMLEENDIHIRFMCHKKKCFFCKPFLYYYPSSANERLITIIHIVVKLMDKAQPSVDRSSLSPLELSLVGQIKGTIVYGSDSLI